MIRNILALRGRRVEDVMVPRGDIIAVHQDITLGELVKVFEKAGHSRLVAYDDTLDDPVGMVHIRDLIAFMTAQAMVDPQKTTKRKKARPAGLDFNAIDLSLPLSSTKIMREMLFVPPSMPAIDLLEKMQATRIHLALVVDEYGGTDGLVSMEDIVEQIVGEIADEHDEDELPAVVRENDGSYVADARASLDDVTAAVGVAFDVGDAAEAVDTIGGYLMSQVGRLPLRGELVPGPEGFEIEVLDSDPRRVKKVRIHRSKNRTIERDREGLRRFSGTDDATAALMTPPASPSEPPPDDAAKAQSSADSSASQKS
jgi:CBS domain containing-hemolysin-like protein